jgi:RimJ/RimL family protein N-acetyltransferase
LVRLDFYHSNFEKFIETYHLTEEQLRFTAHPKDALQKCKVEESRFPIMILLNEELAGFFVLHGWDGVKEFNNNKNALLLRAYSINSSAQGKGVAKESLRLLPSFVKQHFPGVDEIILAVNHQNFAAQHVYKCSGFIDTGGRAMGRSGEMFIFHQDLSVSGVRV